MSRRPNRAQRRTAQRAGTVEQLPTLGGAPIGTLFQPVAQSRRLSQSPFESDENAARILLSALRMADAGQPAELQLAIADMFARDGRASAVARTRTLAITSRRWVVKPPPGFEQDPRAIEVAANVTSIFNATPGFARLRGHLQQGVPCGVGVLEHKWRTNERGWKVSHPEPVESYRIGIDGGEWTKLDPGTDSAPGTKLSAWPDKFVVHSPNAGLSLPHSKRGYARAMLTLALVKRHGLRWWLSNVEQFGKSQIYATLPADASLELLNETAERLRQLSSDGAMAFRGAASIESIAVTADPAAHQNFIDWINVEMAILALGNNLTTEVQGGSFAASQTADVVRGDYLAADAVEGDETITDQWIAPLVRFNWPGAPVPVFETILARTRPWTLAEFTAGICTRDQYRLSNGFDAVDDSTGAQYAAPVAAAPPQAFALPVGGEQPAPFPVTTSPTSKSGPTSPTRRSGPASALLS